MITAVPSVFLIAALALSGAIRDLDSPSSIIEWGKVLAPTIAVMATWLLARRRLKVQDVKLQEIHVLVNDSMSKALVKIETLEARLGDFVNERMAAAIAKVAMLEERIAAAHPAEQASIAKQAAADAVAQQVASEARPKETV